MVLCGQDNVGIFKNGPATEPGQRNKSAVNANELAGWGGGTRSISISANNKFAELIIRTGRRC